MSPLIPPRNRKVVWLDDILVHVTIPLTVTSPDIAPPDFSNLSVARVWSPVVLPATVVAKVERLFVSVAIELVLELIALVLVLRELVRLATSAVFVAAVLVFAVTDVVSAVMSVMLVFTSASMATKSLYMFTVTV